MFKKRRKEREEGTGKDILVEHVGHHIHLLLCGCHLLLRGLLGGAAEEGHFCRCDCGVCVFWELVFVVDVEVWIGFLR